MVKGETHLCHANSASLWYESRGRIRVATGYCRSGDVWLTHSWGMENGRIVETTCFSELYFGIILDELETLRCAFGELPGLVERIKQDMNQGTIFPEVLETCTKVTLLHGKKPNREPR